MNKRISDEELEKALKRVREEKCAVMIFDTDIAEKFVADLIDAREALKKYEPQKPSLSQHLQKLANKHKVCFALNQLQILVVYDRRAFFIVNAEEFFGFNKDNFYCDIEVDDVIYPEETGSLKKTIFESDNITIGKTDE